MVIERCLEKEPGHRYQRASEVGAALEAAHTQQGTSSLRRFRLRLGSGFQEAEPVDHRRYRHGCTGRRSIRCQCRRFA